MVVKGSRIASNAKKKVKDGSDEASEWLFILLWYLGGLQIISFDKISHTIPNVWVKHQTRAIMVVNWAFNV